MARYFLRIEYNGTKYHGWQLQKNASTVQVEINRVVSILAGQEINVTGCGRTDTGVHARDFYAHFDLEEVNKSPGISALKLSKMLPPDIVVTDVLPVVPDAHARFSAVSRTYKYYIARRKDPFMQEFAWLFHGKLNMEVILKGTEIIQETEDFTSFSKASPDTKTGICRILNAHWEQKDHLLVFTITADRFLRNMVRAITGTLIEMGKKRFDGTELHRIIAAKERSRAGLSVPAKGLFLHEVNYPEDIFL